MSTHSPSAGWPADVFRFGEFTFDFGSRQLLCGAEPRHLSPKAQHLLHVLIVARPRALSREELYDALWPSTFVCETNLASIVNELRRVLGDDPRAAQYIRTVHGFGYAFCAEVTAPMPVWASAATLVCEGQNYLLHEGENVVGRAPDCRVVLPAAMISRRHAMIIIDKGEMWIRDLASKNGTFVDGKRIGSAPELLKPRARIEVAAMAMTVVPRKLSSTAALRLDSEMLSRIMSRGLAGT